MLPLTRRKWMQIEIATGHLTTVALPVWESPTDIVGLALRSTFPAFLCLMKDQIRKREGSLSMTFTTEMIINQKEATDIRQRGAAPGNPTGFSGKPIV